EQRHEVVGDAGLVEPPRHLSEREQALDLGGQGEQPAGRVVVVDRLDAEVVARAEQRLATRVPDGEREIAEQTLWAALAPAFVRREDQRGIGDRGSRFGYVERPDQLGAVRDA